MIAEISRLLAQVGKAPNTDARTAAVKRLWEIAVNLEDYIREADRDTLAGVNRRVEAAVYRAALASLAEEMTRIGEQRPT